MFCTYRSAVAAVLVLSTLGCQEHIEEPMSPAQKKKIAEHILSKAPSPQHAINAVIEDQVRLLGVDVDKTAVKPGDSIKVTYYIEALAEPMGDNKPFVHFQGRRNDRRAWMNLDHHPVENLMPLRKLKRGQIVKDVQRFKIRSDFPAGIAKIYWGLFRGNHRLKIANPDQVKRDSEGRIIVATIKVLGSPKNRRPNATAFAEPLKANETVIVDGRLDESFWSRAPWTPWWSDPQGTKRPAPKTRARFVWDDTYLYVGVEAIDSDVWATLTERDSDTWTQEVIELFIDADGDRKDYIELQVTPANVVFDARFMRYRSNLKKARSWNMKGLKTGAHVEGTLNKRDDTDTRFTVEFAVPIREVPGAKHPIKGKQTWKINLFRFDQPKGKPQDSAAFSPPIRRDFHALDRFGTLVFREAKSLKAKTKPTAKPSVSP